MDNGNTVFVIEHNLDVIRTADWLIDLGPDGGDAGGSLVAAGTPEDLALVEDSWTGKYLEDALHTRPHVPADVAGASRFPEVQRWIQQRLMASSVRSAASSPKSSRALEECVETAIDVVDLARTRPVTRARCRASVPG